MALTFGTWHGGPNYAYGGVEDRECFTSLREASDALRNRCNSGHFYAQRFWFINRPVATAMTPCVDESSYVDLYATPTSDDIIGRIEFGPRGGIRKVTA